MTLKNKLATILLGASLALGYSCGDENTKYECYENEQCLEGEKCLDGLCQESSWQECKIQENLQPENFNGTYSVIESDCSNKYNQITFEGENDTYDVGAIDKKTDEFVCLCASADPNLNGNHLDADSHYFIKCNEEIIKMKWYDGECEAWLERTSYDPLPETDNKCM